MKSSALEFLKQLLAAPGVSGYEEPVQEVVRQYSAASADTITTDVHGNVIVCKNPNAKVRVLLAGHADQIGLIVSYIDDKRH